MANFGDLKSDQGVFKSLKRQPVYEVLDFSSQYGTEWSSSYTAGNLVGEPTNYPAYGDFTHALVFRTYGRWWHLCPSTPKPMKRSKPGFTSHDFIDVKFVDPVYPTQVEVYETYNPGAVVRILACNYTEDVGNGNSRWFVLWSGNRQQCPPVSRTFSPTLRKCPFKTRRLRLEFDQEHLEYYTELDAVVLYGLESAKEYKGEQDVQLENTSCENVDRLANTLDTQMSINSCHHNSVKRKCSRIFILPSEVINKIFSYLNFYDLANAAKVCKCFKNYGYDPLWFKELDLQPYWSRINDSDLELLGKRCASTKRLNLSWCGTGDIISSAGFSSFLKQTCGGLCSLYLSCCRFLDENSLSVIKESCPTLKELDMSSCLQIPSEAFKIISSMTCLTRLNVYRTKISDDELCEILRGCTNLHHINLGGCFAIKDYAKTLGSLKHTPNIVSLDLWRVRPLSHETVKTIADNCPNLKEIDLGWSFNFTSSESSSISYLAKHCHKLKKLFLTAVRSVCDIDLITIAENCPLMEQLDILGTSNVSQISVERVLRQCQHMKFFDVSFCSEIDEEWFEDAKTRFPNVSLKKSVT